MPQPKDVHQRRAGRNHTERDAQRPDQAGPAWSEGIRALYDGVVREPLPPDLLRLLRELGKNTED